ncbi:MMPL family transporter [Aequorivita echinoideorum]|uniref:MMPL family transporter n=1 Tax=Aequorivita echinoideorum TaxID=1549647 RepID=UPI00293D2E43|nr:MMPL family transporter [Aequorivita echinoideorum]
MNSENRNLHRVLNSVNFTDKIIVNISRKDTGNVTDLVDFASEFLDSLETNAAAYVKNVRGRVRDEDMQNTMDFVYQNLPLFLNETDYENVSQRLKKDSIDAITQANYRNLISPSGIVSKKTILRDPLGLSFIGLEKLRQLGVAEDFFLKDGFLVSKDEKHILLFITPQFASSETAENAAFAEYLYELKKEFNSKFDKKVAVEYYGAALIAVANAKQIKRDIQFTVAIALSVLLLLFIFFYRNILVPVILFVPTAVGALLAIAILFLLRGEISAISLGIGSVLLGVTLDYSLHILTHIRNNERTETLYKDVSQPILMSSFTTAIAFLCLLFLESQALQDLGIFAAISVLGASIFALIFIPIVYKNELSRKQQITFLDKIAAYNFQRNKWLVGFLVLLLAISGFTYHRVVFEKDLSKLNYESSALKLAMKNLDSLTDVSSKSLYVATYGKSVEGTLQLNDSIFDRLQQLKNNNEIQSFSSIGALVHSQRDQRKSIENWKQFWTKNRIDSTQKFLMESSARLGFKPATFQEFYTFLETDFQTLKPEDYQKIPSMLLEDYIATEADFTTITTLVKLNDNSNSQQIINAFQNTPNTVVIDRQQMNERFLGNLKNDFNALIGYCFIAVLLVLLFFFRSISLTIVTAVPIFLTWFLTVGIMGIVQLEFNIFNIIISTFIFGLGVDYSIFMTKGLLKELRTGEKLVNTHKTSIILSVLTTILGVGVLIFAKHPALYSISIVSIIGIFSAMMLAFTLQPILFSFFMGSKKRRPVTPRMFLNSSFSFAYFGIGGLALSLYSIILMPLSPRSKKAKMLRFHKMISVYMKSVLYTNPFVKKTVINAQNEDFKKPAVIIANHTSFLDILAIGMLHPKICFLVNDWVYKSPIFGKAVQRADFYPVSSGIENSMEHLEAKIKQGFSLMVFPEGSRSATHKIRRFHKGAFFLAEKFGLDILPVLIHGNAEILPKGSFIIKDGSITVKILPRIKFEDKSFGENYTQRAKKVGSYFKSEFLNLRKSIEDINYFHRIILEEYRFKGHKLYRNIKNKLRINGELYHKIISELKPDSTIINLADDCGELDFLMILDGPDRKIFSKITDDKTHQILQNSFLTEQSKNLHFVSNSSEIAKEKIDYLILESGQISNVPENFFGEFSVSTIILLGEEAVAKHEIFSTFGFQKVTEAAKIKIFKRAEFQK